MATEACATGKAKGLSVFERYLTLWVLLCIAGGIVLGKLAPSFARSLDAMAIYVDSAPVVSIPIAICLFLMMYPIMVKIDFAKVIQAGKSAKPVGLTLFINWAVKPFTMYAIALLFLGTLFYGFIGAGAVDYVKMPLGLHDLPLNAAHGAGTVVMHEGVKMLQVPLWRSYLAGCILLGIAPCTAMVLVWGYLAKGNDGHTLVMVAINSLTMLLLYGPLGGFLLGVGSLPVPWQALLLSIAIYVALPLAAGYVSRKWIIKARGREWFERKFLHVLTSITIVALLATLVLLFSFKGGTIMGDPLTILWIAIPLFIQTMLIFSLGYGLAKLLKLSYQDAAPSAMIGASNHFEVAIATATILFGLSSGAALATVVGVLIEVPVMLVLVKICLRTQGRFSPWQAVRGLPERTRQVQTEQEYAMSSEKTHDLVKKAYGDVARKRSSCCGPSSACCGDTKAYTVPDHPVPEAELGLSCGNPLAFGCINKGDVVLDLGSGAGKDVFLAAQKVGEAGKVIGVDMTPEMLALARGNAVKFLTTTGLDNVEFRQGHIEALPVEDASVDVVISNCVINLSPDKPQVFREVHRVLKPGGRMIVSDIVLNRPLPESARNDANLYAACIAGAMLRADYLAAIRDAGFTSVEVVSEHMYQPADVGNDPITQVTHDVLAGAAASITVLAVR